MNENSKFKRGENCVLISERGMICYNFSSLNVILIRISDDISYYYDVIDSMAKVIRR